MSEFLKTLTHGSRLRGAVKELSADELTGVIERLSAILIKRKDAEVELQAKENDRREKLADIKKQLEAAGLNESDLIGLQPRKKSKNFGMKRPIKYKITNEDGVEKTWTGIGRMPREFTEALAGGKLIEDYAI